MFQLRSSIARFNTVGATRRIANLRQFHASFANRISLGETIPSVTVFESSPGNKLVIKDELNGKKSVIIGVPGAFSPGCTATHIPGYIEGLDKFKAKGYENFFVVAINDPFVTEAWKKFLGAPDEVRFISDATGEFTEQLECTFDASSFFGNERSKRYALLVNGDGKVENLFIEPDNVSVNVSKAENVLKNA